MLTGERNRDAEARALTIGARVLVAEDDDDMRDVIVAALRKEGYEVFFATSGDDLLRTMKSIALDAFPSDDVDLLITDVRMPGISGLDALRRMREARCGTPAIVMTAFPNAEVAEEARRLDAVLLPKPFSLEALTGAALATLLFWAGEQPRSALR